MLDAKTRWSVNEVDQEKADQFVEHLGISPLVAGLLVNRGKEDITEASEFLHIENSEFHDPFLLDGMEIAVERIKSAIENQEKIMIFGDYDADGVSSTSVMYFTLRELGADFDYYIPNRFTEGYGPNEAAFRWIKEQGYSVIITVDTGISAIHEATVAKEIGIDLIITDHHEPQPELPDSYTTINPKKPGCSYPFKGLAGVGVAIKVAHALLGKPPVHLLDIACIGTIADLVPLVGENRLIAKRGITRLQRTEKPGLQALIKLCNINDQVLNAEHIGFGIGPRVNAAGRLDSADPAVDLFTTNDPDEAEMIAQEIDAMNKERQNLVTKMTKEAIEIVENEYPPENQSALVIAKEGWNPGVIGIVASRIVEKYYRPTIILSIDPDKGVAKGSARSIAGFDMFANLSECRDILPHFGGHPMAAGMTLDLAHLEELRSRLDQLASEKLNPEDFTPITTVDLKCSVDDISLEVIEELQTLEPFGVDNPKPKFLIEPSQLKEFRRIGSDSKHLKLTLKGEQAALDVIGFHFGEIFEEITPHASLSVVGELSINEWNGFRKPQLMLKDIAVKEKQLFDYRGIKNLKERLDLLNADKVQLIAFQTDTVAQLQLGEWKNRIYHVTETSTLEQIKLDGHYLMILDLPSNKEQLEELISYGSKAERVYTVFHHEEDHYFNPIPTRESFRWFYAFLKKQGRFEYKKKAKELASFKGWSVDSVYFMSKVFFELEFVTIDNGIITVTDQPIKRPLTDSITYRRKQEQSSLENDLCYSSYRDLKRWFFEKETDGVRFEEAY
ncbi:single-stranded-DNA-specific exonuclease RecJ [Pseudalkalibacillus berkeleyi]|uniref:Single-stranded-DNA-specific exonuclease RecJ n=1 Tax=Pseudalkalibacillus berkeleyi TaxID=1069813 RepID=A0ABS9GZ81_9BACL|nr:single-stranded-DNA-specific exonuclease RecJ [Pseudalkalibacillus berkeleyi]MCF6138062.1 single-stranded-DNA-specific exonuclease RecJ [Pseudalkalibacillus berkeleyi]